MKSDIIIAHKFKDTNTEEKVKYVTEITQKIINQCIERQTSAEFQNKIHKTIDF